MKLKELTNKLSLQALTPEAGAGDADIAGG